MSLFATLHLDLSSFKIISNFTCLDTILATQAANKLSATNSKRRKTIEKLKNDERKKNEKWEINENELKNDQNTNDVDLNEVETSNTKQKSKKNFDSNEEEMTSAKRSKCEIDEFFE